MTVLEKIIYRFKIIRNSKKIKNNDITLISQNCLGGVIYHDFGMPLNSPTINMFIEDENFVKLVENIEHYLSITPQPVCDRYIDPIDPSIIYPKIRIDDIELCCLHYNDCNDAIDAWERRKARVNLNNIVVIANSWNLHDNLDLIKRVCSTKYKTVCFCDKEYGNIEGCVYLKGDFWKRDRRGIVRPNITDFVPNTTTRYYEKYINILDVLNSGK